MNTKGERGERGRNKSARAWTTGVEAAMIRAGAGGKNVVPSAMTASRPVRRSRQHPRTTIVAAGLLLLGAAQALIVAPAAEAVGVPTVSSVSPSSGSTAGGTRVTVTGSGFAHVSAVRFGSLKGTSISVVSSSKLRVTSPAHAPGTVDVRVTTAAGTSSARNADHFTYVAPPSVTQVSPTSGVTTGGTRVTVTGARFRHVTSVKFGSTAGTALKVISSTSLQVTTPAHAVGTVDVHVVTRYGTSATVPVDRYRYTGWVPTALPLPADWKWGGADFVSCGGPGVCAAAGNYTDASMGLHTVLWRLSNGRWTKTVPPLPAMASSFPDPQVWGLSCGSSGTCTVWGEYQRHVNGFDRSTAVFWTSTASGAWTATLPPIPAAATTNDPTVVPHVLDVACGGAGQCAARGYYSGNSTVAVHLLWRFDGQSWSYTVPPVPAGTPEPAAQYVVALACSSTATCVAVGSYGQLFTEEALWSLADGTWTVTTVPLSAGVPAHASCGVSGLCIAWGQHLADNSDGHSAVWVFSAGAWARADLPLPADAAGSPMTSVHQAGCGSADVCTAAGSYVDAAGDTMGVLWTYASGTWHATKAPLPSDAGLNPRPGFTSLVCDATDVCLLQGHYTTTVGSTNNQLWTFSGGHWSLTTTAWATNPASVLSCVPDACAQRNVYPADPEIWTLHNGKWTGQMLQAPADAALPTGLDGLSCGAAGGCAAIGSYAPQPNAQPSVPVAWVFHS